MKIPDANLLVTITMQVFEGHDVSIKFDSPQGGVETGEIVAVVAAISALAGVVSKHTGESEQEVLKWIAGFEHNVQRVVEQ